MTTFGNTFTKQGHINRYIILCNMFLENPSMECSIVMAEEAGILMREYGLTAAEIEQIELDSIA